MMFVGVDQGGTKSQVAVCDAGGGIIGAATGVGAIFYQNDSENISTATARALADKILTDAGLSWDCVAWVCGGLSGLDWPHETAIHEARLREGFGLENVTAVNDSVIALRAGSASANRCVIVAGTGLNIATHAEDGAEYVYGYHIPNHFQGGGALGGAIIDAVIEAETGVRPPTRLTDAVLSLSSCPTVRRFLTEFTSGELQFKPQLLYPALLEAVSADDDAAKEIIGAFIGKLASYSRNALTVHLPRNRPAELVFSGGIFKGPGRFVSDSLTRILAPEFSLLRFVNSRLEPVCGALLMSLDKHYGGNIPVGVIQKFDDECARHGLLRN